MFKSTCPSKSYDDKWDNDKWGGYGGGKNDKWDNDKWDGYGGKDKWNDCDDKYSKYEDCDSKYDKYDDCDSKYDKCDDKWDGGYGGKNDDWSYSS
ncbi:hypothetical protein [Pseudonocardia sp.]|jgi:hypothetical protein|uniref:hypothetical protein n=1 Tax=Pseudonocardia sp. TaxID=60912 RepID=UPI003D11B964